MKKILTSLFVSISILLNAPMVSATDINTNPVFDTTNLNMGIIAISYDADNDSKLKVMIEKEEKRVTYYLKSDGIVENFPLQFGNGEYKISVLKNIEGDKYRYISTKNLALDLADDKRIYLNSIQNINWNGSMDTIKKAEELTKDLKSDSQKIDTIYQYVLDSISYDYERVGNLGKDYLPNIDNILASGKGICYDYSSVFAAMLRSVGIPAKLVKGYSSNITGYHAWNEIYNSETEKWITIDTTYDVQMKEANVKYSIEKVNSQYKKVFEY